MSLRASAIHALRCGLLGCTEATQSGVSTVTCVASRTAAASSCESSCCDGDACDEDDCDEDDCDEDACDDVACDDDNDDGDAERRGMRLAC